MTAAKRRFAMVRCSFLFPAQLTPISRSPVKDTQETSKLAPAQPLCQRDHNSLAGKTLPSFSILAAIDISR
jgi:hypothetical protein